MGGDVAPSSTARYREAPECGLAASLYRGDDLVKALAMLKAFFDDSGTHGEALITTISGFMAPAKVWERLEIEWLDVLSDYKSRYGVTWYHATDVAAWREEWAAVPLDPCRDAPMRFAAILGRHNVLPVWAAVRKRGFPAIRYPRVPRELSHSV